MVDLLGALQTPWILELFQIAVGVRALVGFLALPRTYFRSRRCVSTYRRRRKDPQLVEVSRDDRPFFGEAGGGLVVFRAEIRDADGSTRQAFNRSGNDACGFLGHHDLSVGGDDGGDKMSRMIFPLVAIMPRS